MVNGRDLRDLVRNAELPFATAERHPDIAGGYAGVGAELLMSDHFLGHGQGTYKGDVLERESAPNRVAVLACECGEVGCWPLIVSIDVDEDIVNRSAFHQPYRRNWTYGTLVPFTFHRAEYEAALRRAGASVDVPKQ
jgi:hypothetical protein